MPGLLWTERLDPTTPLTYFTGCNLKIESFLYKQQHIHPPFQLFFFFNSSAGGDPLPWFAVDLARAVVTYWIKLGSLKELHSQYTNKINVTDKIICVQVQFSQTMKDCYNSTPRYNRM